MAKAMKVCTFLSILATGFCGALYAKTQASFLLTCVITLGTVSYHFSMRLFVGTLIQFFLQNHVNYQARWFQVGAAEQKLYRKLKVQKWKAKMPTFDPTVFDRKCHSWDEIAQATCQAELVHEVIIALSFLPIFAAIPFGALWVFITTSLLAACIDLSFVMMQRHNRPRLLRLIKKCQPQ